MLPQALRLRFALVEFKALPPDFFRRQAVDIRVVKFPVGAGRPFEGRLLRGAWPGGVFEQAKGKRQRDSLRLCVVRPPRRIAQRKIREQQARRAHVFDDVAGATHHHCGDAVGLQQPRDQAQALVADRAIGHQDGSVNAIVALRRNKTFNLPTLSINLVLYCGRGNCIQYFDIDQINRFNVKPGSITSSHKPTILVEAGNRRHR